jgi:hypothetical protein
MKRKHYEQIIAWAEGATIQYLEGGIPSNWEDVYRNNPSWNESEVYRVKPKTVRFRLYLHRSPHDHDVFRVIVFINNTPLDPLIPENNMGFIRWLGDWQEVEV